MEKYLSNIFVLISISVLTLLHGCGGATPTTPAQLPISIESLDGATDIAVDSSFKYSFTKPVSTPTVGGATFFILPASDEEYGVSGALPATTACSSSTSCVLDPTNDLDGGTSYTIQLTTEITYTDGAPFEGFSATFTTAGFGISSLKDANGEEVGRSGSTGVQPTSFEIAFSDELGDTSAAEAAVSLACGNLTPSISATCTGSTCNVSVTDAWRYGMMGCTLTIGTGAGLSQAVAYAFTNACALNDDFNAQTISDEASSCWKVSTIGTSYTTWAEMNDIFAIDTQNSILDADFTGEGDKFTVFYKEIILEDDYEVEVKFNSVSGINHSNGTIPTSVATIVISDGLDVDTSILYEVGFFGNEGNQYCFILGVINATDPRIYGTECNEDQVYYFKFARSGDTYTTQYKLEGGEYEDLPLANDKPWPPPLTSGAGYLIIAFDSNPTGGEKASIDNIIVDGITTNGQY